MLLELSTPNHWENTEGINTFSCLIDSFSSGTVRLVVPVDIQNNNDNNKIKVVELPFHHSVCYTGSTLLSSLSIKCNKIMQLL